MMIQALSQLVSSDLISYIGLAGKNNMLSLNSKFAKSFDVKLIDYRILLVVNCKNMQDFS